MRRPFFEALEPRWLLSADLPGLAIPIDGTHVTAVSAVQEAPAAQRQEIAFIDGGLPDAQELARDMEADTPERHLEVVVLDPSADGFAQVSAELAKRQGLDAVHLIGHGSDGSITLGTSLLDAGEATRRAATLVRWHNALKPDADILLYGCRSAYGIGGETLLQTLADLTGADVAGSVDATGAPDLGGNWVLERQTGRVDAALALSLRMQQSYSALLAAPVAVNDSYSVNEDSTLVVEPSATGLQDLWRFDDGAGSQTATDSSGSANNATLGSTAGADANDPSWTTGRAGTAALSFDGTSNYLSASSAMLQSASSFTLSAWIKSDTTTGAHHVFWAGYAGGNGWGDPSGGPSVAEMNLSVGRFDQNNRITFFLGYDASNPGGDGIDIVSLSTFTDTTRWHHVAVVVSGGTGTLYVDGVFEGSDTGVENDRSAWSSELRIGSSGGAGRNFDGMIDEARVYSTALSAADVTALARAGILQNDTDPNQAGLTTALVSGPSNGTLSLGGDGSFTYAPNLNFNGTDTFTYQANDGTANSNVATVTITVNPVNDPPTATNLGAAETYTEDTPLNLTDIVVSDVDSANVTATLTLSNVAAGSLNTATAGAVTSTYNALTGVWTASGALANVNTLLAGLTFTPSLNFNSSFTIATSVDDGVAPAITGSKAITGTPANDAPAVTATGSTLAYTENAAATTIDPGLSVSDADSATLTGATVTISANYANGEDVLAFTDQLGITGSWSAATGVLTLTGTTTLANYQTALQSVTYVNTSDNPNTLTRTVSFVVNDGATNSSAATRDINVTPVNDAPTANNLSAAETYTEDTPLNLTDIVVSDVDSANVTVTLTLSNTAAGSLNTATAGAVTSTYVAGTGVWTASGAIANVNTLLAGLTFTPSLNFNSSFTIATSVDDGVAPAITGSKAMTGTPVNDAPTASNLSAAETYTENTPLNLTDIVVSDVDSANVTVTLTLSNTAAGSLNTATAGAVTSTYVAGTGVWTASGAIANVNTLLAGLTFTPSLNFNSSFTIATSVDDGVAPAITGSKAITGTPANDAPAVTATGSTLAYTENAAATTIDPGLSVSDADSATLTGATVTISANYANGEDVLAFTDQLGITGSWSAATGVLTLTGTTTLANYQTALQSVTYVNTSDNPNTLTRTVSFVVNDGATNSSAATRDINVAAVNDAPTTSAVTLVAIAEDSGARLITQAELLANAADVDGPVLTATGLAITSGSGTLVDNGNGTWTYTPALNDDTSASFTYTVTDGAAPVAATASLDITQVNDAPSLPAATLSVAQGGATTIVGTSFPVTDPDGPAPVFTVQNVVGGYFESVTAPGTPILTFTAAQLASGQIRFVHTGGATAPSFQVSASDGAIATPFVNATITFVPTNTTPSDPAVILDLKPPALIIMEAPAIAGGGNSSTTAVLVAAAQSPKTILQATVPPLAVPRKPATPTPAPRPESGGGAPGFVAENINRGGAETGKPGNVAFTLPAVTLPPTTVPDAPALTEPDLPLAARAQLIAELSGVLEDEPEPTRLELIMKSAQLSGLALSVGVVTWILRAGGLISSLLASLPAWRHMDPLPILARDKDEEEDEDETRKRRKLAEEQDEKKVDRVFAQV